MKRKPILPLLGLFLAAAILFCLWYFTRPDTEAGSKDVTVTVIHRDASETVFQVHTNAEYLAQALLDHQIVEDNQGPYGLYILTADGETADESKQEWWCITKDGEMLTVGADEVPLADGDCYELTLTVGYDI
jgi:hypothetical protein